MTEVKAERFVPMRESLLWLFDGDMYSALLLDVMLDKQSHFDREGELVDGYFYRSLSKLESDLMGGFSKGAIRKRIEAWELEPWFDTFVPDHPDEARRFKVDIVALNKALACGGYSVPRWHVSGAVSEEHTPLNPVSQEHTPVSEEHKERSKPQELTNKQSHERASEQDEQPDDPPPQPDPVSTDPPDALDEWIVWRGKRMNYDISPQQAMKVAMGVADFGLGDDEERRYIRETMTSCAIAEKAPGQWAYYVVQRGNYETWRGETEDDTNTDTTYVDGYEW